MNKKVRAIAFYLPQFYPIPENDAWWGEGFTEWTNVRKAVPLFEGHQQPVIPGELGYYDLRDTSVREKQAILAKEHGIEGFCYWHYWFGNGKRILERVFDEVLASGKPDFPFCLAWANESWTGVWHGAEDRILVEQQYPGEDDYRMHFEYLSKAFADKRYIRVDGKPILIVYHPHKIPELKNFVALFRGLSASHGYTGLYLIGNNTPEGWNPEKHGFDAVAPTGLHLVRSELQIFKDKIVRLSKKVHLKPMGNLLSKGPFVFEYDKYMQVASQEAHPPYKKFPCILSNWDNTPRSGRDGWVLKNANAGKFKTLLEQSVAEVESYPPAERFIFIKSWNEWAEGNYIEPDKKNGKAYLQSCQEVLFTNNH